MFSTSIMQTLQHVHVSVERSHAETGVQWSCLSASSEDARLDKLICLERRIFIKAKNAGFSRINFRGGNNKQLQLL